MTVFAGEFLARLCLLGSSVTCTGRWCCHMSQFIKKYFIYILPWYICIEMKSHFSLAYCHASKSRLKLSVGHDNRIHHESFACALLAHSKKHATSQLAGRGPMLHTAKTRP